MLLTQSGAGSGYVSLALSDASKQQIDQISYQQEQEQNQVAPDDTDMVTCGVLAGLFGYDKRSTCQRKKGTGSTRSNP